LAVEAYILVQAQTGKAQSIKKEIQLVPGVIRVDRVMGPFDLVILVQAENNQEIGEKILREVQQINGVKRTLTCPVI